MTDTLDRIPLAQLIVVDCPREHVEEELPKTAGQWALDVLLFLVCMLVILVGCALMAIGSLYVWFYWAVSQ
jgi:hypothetical protein